MPVEKGCSIGRQAKAMLTAALMAVVFASWSGGTENLSNRPACVSARLCGNNTGSANAAFLFSMARSTSC